MKGTTWFDFSAEGSATLTATVLGYAVGGARHAIVCLVLGMAFQIGATYGRHQQWNR